MQDQIQHLQAKTFLPSSRHFDLDAAFVVIVFLSTEHVPGFHFIIDGRIGARLHIEKLSQLRIFFSKKNEVPSVTLSQQCWVIFLIIQGAIALSDSVDSVNRV